MDNKDKQENQLYEEMFENDSGLFGAVDNLINAKWDSQTLKKGAGRRPLPDGDGNPVDL